MSFGGTINEDPKLRLAIKECPVHFLNSASDFPAWMVALQRLVTGVGMADSLLYSMPLTEAVEIKRKRMAMGDLGHVVPDGTPPKPAVADTPASKQKEKDKDKDKDKNDKARESKGSPEVQPIKPDAKLEAALEALGATLGATSLGTPAGPNILMDAFKTNLMDDDFFATTVEFINVKRKRLENAEEVFYRHHIWRWMEQSLSWNVQVDHQFGETDF